MCINYKQLNSIIKKDRYPLPLISEIQDRIGNAQIFLKIDLRQVYHQIQIRKGDKQKEVFKTKKGLFKLTVMQFRFTNTPVIFQRRINYILRKYLDDFVIIYLDNIIIYLNSKKEYKEYVKQVLKRLYKENILVIIKKYKFHTIKTDFVEFIIKLGQISMDLKQIKTIINQ